MKLPVSLHLEGPKGDSACQTRQFEKRGDKDRMYVLHSRRATAQMVARHKNVHPKNARRKARRAGSGKQSATKGQSTVGQVNPRLFIDFDLI